jgi:hypothetical protein
MIRPVYVTLLVSAFLSGVVSEGRELIVATTGNDDHDGSSAHPLSTIQHAFEQAKPGDKVHVLAGTYHERLFLETSGTAGSPITLEGDPGAVISGRGVDEGEHLIYIENQSHISITGFEMRDLRVKDGSAIRVEGYGEGFIFRNNRIHEIRGKDAMGITLYGTDPKRPINNVTIEGNEIWDCDPAKSEALTLNGNVSNFRILNNRVHDVNNIGIDMIGGEDEIGGTTRNGLVKGNIVYRCRSPYEGGYAAGIYVDGGHDIIIEDNVITGCDLGIEVGAENARNNATGIKVRNNKIFLNHKAGIVFGGYDKATGRVKQCSFTGNVCFDNNRDRKSQNGELWVQWAQDCVVSGNSFITDSKNSPLVKVEAGAGQNAITDNRYHSSAGVGAALFIFKEQRYGGFSAWKSASGWDNTSKFEEIEVKLPSFE